MSGWMWSNRRTNNIMRIYGIINPVTNLRWLRPSCFEPDFAGRTSAPSISFEPHLALDEQYHFTHINDAL
jgi:hypothetical protein